VSIVCPQFTITDIAQQQLLILNIKFNKNIFSTSQAVTSIQDDDINNSSTQMQMHLKHSLQSQPHHTSDYETLQNKMGMP
jgi:glycosyltransferase A (GT-A) superfamily protein (DUF2064 family)